VLAPERDLVNNSSAFNPNLTMLTLVLYAILGFAVCAATLWVFVRSPLVKYFADAPDHRKVHQWIVPRFGGLGLVATFLFLLAVSTFADITYLNSIDGKFLATLAFIGLFILCAGTMDDVHPLDYKVKFLFQFLLAGVVVCVFGSQFHRFVFLGHTFELNGAGAVISIFWMVAVMNAVNIIDGVDGLASTVALCSLSAIGAVAWSNGAQELAWVSAVLIGSLLGFLRFNFHSRHKIFLGDTGSQFLGAMLAFLTMEVQGLPDINHRGLVPLLLIGYPLFDITVAMMRRFSKRGQRSLSHRITRMFAADNDHLHHRLVYLGLSHIQVTFLLSLIAGTMGATAIVLVRTSLLLGLSVVVYMGFALFLVLNRLGFVGLKPWVVFPRIKPLPSRIVGILDPDDIFLHSLKSSQQEEFDFLPVATKLTSFIGSDLTAVVMHNVDPARFDEQWAALLRIQEFQELPAVVVAGERELDRVKAMNKEGFRMLRFVAKPAQVPELLRALDTVTAANHKSSPVGSPEKRFSLAALAMRQEHSKE
jgi:UDP-GlcNAc:undecaprenyl-phosphate/decaprenyl-phosphate GlcNAc-1-phosphate transferase